MGEVLTHTDCKEQSEMVIDDSILKSLQLKHGMIVGLHLAVFLDMFKRYGDGIMQVYYPQRTYYHYRRLLYLDNYLTDEDIKSDSGPRWIVR